MGSSGNVDQAFRSVYGSDFATLKRQAVGRLRTALRRLTPEAAPAVLSGSPGRTAAAPWAPLSSDFANRTSGRPAPERAHVDAGLLALQQRLEEALGLRKHDELDGLARRDAGALARQPHRFVETPEAVDEPRLRRLAPRPDAALRELLDLGRRLVPPSAALLTKVS
jgi:hypothetical protein